MIGIKRSYLIVLVCLIIGVCLYLIKHFSDEQKLVESHTREITPRGNLADFEQSTISIFNSAAPSVVYIFTENAVSGVFGHESSDRGLALAFYGIAKAIL